MKNFYLLLPMFVGAFIVGQGILNRKIGSVWNLSQAVFLNMVVALLMSLFYISYQKYTTITNDTALFEGIKWWYILPGIFGFFIVTLIPITIAEIGSFKVFLITICSQLTLSLILDIFIENIPLTPNRIIGALLALASIIMINL